MKASCGIDTKDCRKTRQECDKWARCTMSEIAEGNEKGIVQKMQERIAELEATIAENKKRWAKWLDTTDAKRIKELEDLLCEAEAISLHNFQRYQAAIEEDHISGFDHRIGWSDLSEEQRKAIIEVHREMLHAEGKL